MLHADLRQVIFETISLHLQVIIKITVGKVAFLWRFSFKTDNLQKIAKDGISKVSVFR